MAGARWRRCSPRLRRRGGARRVTALPCSRSCRRPAPLCSARHSPPPLPSLSLRRSRTRRRTRGDGVASVRAPLFSTRVCAPAETDGCHHRHLPPHPVPLLLSLLDPHRPSPSAAVIVPFCAGHTSSRRKTLIQKLRLISRFQGSTPPPPPPPSPSPPPHLAAQHAAQGDAARRRLRSQLHLPFWLRRSRSLDMRGNRATAGTTLRAGASASPSAPPLPAAFLGHGAATVGVEGRYLQLPAVPPSLTAHPPAGVRAALIIGKELFHTTAACEIHSNHAVKIRQLSHLYVWLKPKYAIPDLRHSVHEELKRSLSNGILQVTIQRLRSTFLGNLRMKINEHHCIT